MWRQTCVAFTPFRILWQHSNRVRKQFCKLHCHTVFDTLHHAPSGAICRAPAHTRSLGIASEFYLLRRGFKMGHHFKIRDGVNRLVKTLPVMAARSVGLVMSDLTAGRDALIHVISCSPKVHIATPDNRRRPPVVAKAIFVFGRKASHICWYCHSPSGDVCSVLVATHNAVIDTFTSAPAISAVCADPSSPRHRTLRSELCRRM